MYKPIILSFFILFIIDKSISQTSYNKLVNKGSELILNNNIDSAIKVLTLAINKKPNSYEAYFYRSYAFYCKKYIDEALHDDSIAISLNKNSLILYELRAKCFFEIENYNMAILNYNIVINKNSSNKYLSTYPPNESPKRHYLYFERGTAFYLNQDYEKAINDLNQAIMLGSKLSINIDEYYLIRGLAYFKREQYDLARKDLENYTSKNTSHYSSIFYLALCYQKLNLNDLKLKLFKILKELDPSSELKYNEQTIDAFLNISSRRDLSLFYFNQAKEKIKDLKNATSNFFSNIIASDILSLLDSSYIYNPKINLKDKQYLDSIKTFYFEVYPKISDKKELNETIRKYIILASNAANEKRFDESIALWEKVIKIQPYNSIAYYNLALLYEIKGYYSLAILNMKNYITLEPNASDIRAAKDKLYIFESKILKSSSNNYQFLLRDINIENNISKKLNNQKGRYYFALSSGFGFGFHFGENNALAKYWNNLDGHGNSSETSYTDFFRFGWTANIEAIIRPINFIGLGFFYQPMGGLGISKTINDQIHKLNLTSYQMGGFLRFIFLQGDARNTLDYYIQINYGTNNLKGSYSKSINYTKFYIKELTGNNNFLSFGIGMGGKIGKHYYLSIDLQYHNSQISNINYFVSLDNGNPSTANTRGIEPGLQINYSGIIFHFMIAGLCF